MGGWGFAGMAGEAVLSVLRPRALATLLPVVALLALLAVPVSLGLGLLGAPPPLVLLACTLVGAPVVGRFALAARDGHPGASFFEVDLVPGQLGAFVLRYTTLTLAWGLPLLLASDPLVVWMGATPTRVGTLAAAGVAALMTLAVALAILLGTTLSALVAARCDSVGETFSADAWRWLLVGRRADLLALHVVLLGGTLVLLAAVWPPLLALGLLLGPIHPSTWTVAAALGVGVSAANTSVLLGRLAGAFVGAEATDEVHVGPEAVDLEPALEPLRPALDADSDAARAIRAFARATEPAASPSEALRLVRDLAEASLDDAIAVALRLSADFGTNPVVAAEGARLYRRAGRLEEARRAAAVVIDRALRSGLLGPAVEVFREFAAERDALPIRPDALGALGWALCDRGHLDEALWSFQRLAEAGGAPEAVERGLVAVAEAAARSGQHARALALHRLFLARRPGSAEAERVRRALAELERDQES